MDEGTIEHRPTIETNTRMGDLATQIEMELAKMNDASVWGHGTSAEIATIILNEGEGIYAGEGDGLNEIAIRISDGSEDPTSTSRAVVEKSTHWPHKDQQAVVIITIPPGLQRHQVIELVERDGRKRTRIPSRFILGFVDGSDNKFVSNSSHELYPEPTTDRQTEFTQGGYTRGADDREVITIPTSPPEDNDVPDVW